jgi:predicted nucleic acid-binding protein
MRKVFVDTSVLFPFSVMDLFLALAEDRAHLVLWTEELLDEWERVIVREQHRTPASAAAVTAAIREFFDDTRIDPSFYRDRVGDMPGPDPDDHVHSAAALAAKATELITWDTSGFPADELAKLGLPVIDPDTYLVELLDDRARWAQSVRRADQAMTRLR